MSDPGFLYIMGEVDLVDLGRVTPPYQIPDVVVFYTKPGDFAARERIVLDPSVLITNEVETRGGKCIVAFGENNHHGSGTLDYETSLLKDLHRKFGIKGIFLEENRDLMSLVKQYSRTGIKTYFSEGPAARQPQIVLAPSIRCGALWGSLHGEPIQGEPTPRVTQSLFCF